MVQKKQPPFRFHDIFQFMSSLYAEDLHAKRIYSLANATLGVMTGAALGVQSIGAALAQARGLFPKHAVKQVDRLLSNQGIDVWEAFAKWVPYVVGARESVVLAMDWTDFARAFFLPCQKPDSGRICRLRERNTAGTA